MSTEFTSTATDELAFVRFFGGAGRGTCFEFGTVSQFERVLAAMEAGEQFLPVGECLDLDPDTADELRSLMADGRVTFGEFGVAVEAGSGELFRFTVEE